MPGSTPGAVPRRPILSPPRRCSGPLCDSRHHGVRVRPVQFAVPVTLIGFGCVIGPTLEARVCEGSSHDATRRELGTPLGVARFPLRSANARSKRGLIESSLYIPCLQFGGYYLLIGAAPAFHWPAALAGKAHCATHLLASDTSSPASQCEHPLRLRTMPWTTCTIERCANSLAAACIRPWSFKLHSAVRADSI